jgi:hypothetical protein
MTPPSLETDGPFAQWPWELDRLSRTICPLAQQTTSRDFDQAGWVFPKGLLEKEEAAGWRARYRRDRRGGLVYGC